MSEFNKCFIISIVMCFVVNVTCELTVDVAYSMLEKKIGNLEMDTFSGMAKINDRMESIEMLIKYQMTSQPLPNKGSDSGPDNKHVDANKDVRKVKATVLKAFASEKHHIRNVLEKCEKQIMDFKQTVNEHMQQLYDSYEAKQNEHIVTTARINDSLKQFKLNTDLKLEGIVVDFQTALKNTDTTLETTIAKQDNLQTLTKNIEKDLSSQKDDIRSIKSDLSSINSGLSSTKNDVSSVNRDINYINSGMRSLRRDIKSVKSDLSSTESGLSSAKSDISSLRSNISSLEDSQKNDIRSIKSDLSSINNGLSSTKNDVSSVNRDINSINSDMRSMGRDLKYVKSDLSSTESGLSSAKRDLSSLRSNISSLEDKRVGFTARLTKNNHLYAENKSIVFNDLRSSYGGGYSTSTGEFTAPKSGLYLFQFNVESYMSQKVHVRLYVNGHLLAAAKAQEGDAITGSNTAVAYMDRGDIAFVKTASYVQTYGITEGRTSFTGVLIH